MVECITTELIMQYMEEYHSTIEIAMDKIYNSNTYTKLIDLRTGLYLQSPLYVYDIFKDELTSNPNT
jgi:hypothetical protein